MQVIKIKTKYNTSIGTLIQFIITIIIIMAATVNCASGASITSILFRSKSDFCDAGSNSRGGNVKSEKFIKDLFNNVGGNFCKS